MDRDMKTLLYNTETNTPGAIREGRYMVDGKIPELPSHIVELTIVENERPAISEDEKLSADWIIDLEKKEYRREYTVIKKTKEELTPRVITKAQGLLQLKRLGLYEQFKQGISSSTEEEQIIFESTKEWEYDNALVNKFVEAFGFSEDQKMDFFINANKIIV